MPRYLLDGSLLTMTNTKRCTAKSKQSGKRCKRLPSVDREVCAMHGGKSPKGFAAAAYKHGRHSKYLNHLPSSKQERFEANARDATGAPSLTEEINLTMLHLQEVVEMLGDSTFFANWQSVRSLVRDLKIAVYEPEFKDGKRKTPEPRVIFNNLDMFFVKISGALRTWNEIHDLNEKLRKLQESNSKLRLQNLEEDQERGKLVPAEIFRAFVLEVGKLFELSPADVRRIQMDGLQSAFGAQPKVIREPKQLTAGE